MTRATMLVAMDLNLHQARYLVAVVDEGHFGRAAERLFVSPPALSKQVRALERALGAELVDRTAHPVRPTAAGELFLAEARDALAAADRAIAAVRRHRQERAGTLRLGFMTASAGQAVQQVLDQVRRATECTVRLVQLGWSEQVEAVRAGRVDAAVVRPPFADTSGLRLDVLRLEPRVVALPVGHRLAARASVCLAELDGLPHVADDEVDQRWVRWWACDPRPSGVPVRYGPVVHTMDELLEVVAADQAVAITGGSVPDGHRHPGVAFVPVQDVAPCPISLCTRAGDRAPPVVALRRAVLESAGQEPPGVRDDRG
ncbi:LysR family transcriptional regulator [Pseudonocardia sp. WMMC193]|uniref:LysR family transcriptional regulator n=1 Tax=Pseudonocardia sp. WMMC193 TaxID=2911965 RepID=UPI001F240499|nr:LysR family transcriptional regulator [Pseudonocardia sp. WMMC193]MCF7551735.1 LysR family transcriptional regulator [Pseudonocardia sp. WMMC193]